MHQSSTLSVGLDVHFQEDIRAMTEHTERLERLEQERNDQVQPWRLRPVVETLHARRGVQCTVAGTAPVSSPPDS